MPAAGAVRARRPARLVALARHDVAARAHRAGDDTEVADVGLDRTLAGDPQLGAVVDLALGEVVMAVDALRLPAVADEREHLAHRVVHHLVAVGPGVVLGPQHVADVGLELRACPRRSTPGPGPPAAARGPWPDAGPWRCASARAGCRCPGCPSAAPPTPGPARRRTARRSGCPSRACRTAWSTLVACLSASSVAGLCSASHAVGVAGRHVVALADTGRDRPARCGRAAARGSRAAGPR